MGLRHPISTNKHSCKVQRWRPPIVEQCCWPQELIATTVGGATSSATTHTRDAFTEIDLQAVGCQGTIVGTISTRKRPARGRNDMVSRTGSFDIERKAVEDLKWERRQESSSPCEEDGNDAVEQMMEINTQSAPGCPAETPATGDIALEARAERTVASAMRTQHEGRRRAGKNRSAVNAIGQQRPADTRSREVFLRVTIIGHRREQIGRKNSRRSARSAIAGARGSPAGCGISEGFDIMG